MGQADLQWQRLPVQRSVRWRLAIPEVAAGHNEPMVVALDYVGEPAGVGFGADEDEWRRRGQGFVRAGTAVADSERFEPPRLVDAVTWLCGRTVTLAARATGRSIRSVTKPLPALV